MSLDRSKPTILAVDDAPANIDVVKAALTDHYTVQAATSGETALKILRCNRPDLILLDIIMPDMDGYEVCKLIKASSATQDIPIIFFTVKAEEEDETYGLSLGAVDYITKPISRPILRERVRTHLALQQVRHALEEQNRQLREAARLREDVDSMMRHDLKGPLTPIIGMTSILMMDDNLTPIQREHLRSVIEAGQTVLRMINMSLDMFKMERGLYRLNPVTVDLAGILRRVLRDQEKLADKRGIGFEFQMAGESLTQGKKLTVTAEELLAYSLFTDLTRNAIEASPSGKVVRIEAVPDGQTARVAIANQGEVPETIRDRFFDKYVTAGKKGAMGLGTYSARLMAETLGGKIELDASQPGATTITVSLPLATAKDLIDAPALTREQHN